MKKIVLTFGLIGGALIAVMMFATMPFADRIGFDKGVFVGYTTMILAFMLRVLRHSLVSRKCERRPHNIWPRVSGGNPDHAGCVCLLRGCLGDHVFQIHAGLS